MISDSLRGNILLFQDSLAAAQPIDKAQQLKVAALRKAGADLLAQIDTELASQTSLIEEDEPTGYPGDMVKLVQQLSQAAEDSKTLSELRGLLGRAVFNLNQSVA